MEESLVKVSMRSQNDYDCSFAIVTKRQGDLQKSVIVILHDLECGVFDFENLQKTDDFRFLLLKQYDDADFALKDYYKIIGKMCHKNIANKYFLNHKDEYNRIKFIDFQTETMDFDYEDEQLCARFNVFRDFIKNFRENFLPEIAQTV